MDCDKEIELVYHIAQCAERLYDAATELQDNITDSYFVEGKELDARLALDNEFDRLLEVEFTLSRHFGYFDGLAGKLL